jgi:hypothetical protein
VVRAHAPSVPARVRVAIVEDANAIRLLPDDPLEAEGYLSLAGSLLRALTVAERFQHARQAPRKDRASRSPRTS